MLRSRKVVDSRPKGCCASPAHARATELLDQSDGRLERAAVLGDVLPEQHHPLVLSQRHAHGVGNGVEIPHLLRI